MQQLVDCMSGMQELQNAAFTHVYCSGISQGRLHWVEVELVGSPGEWTALSIQEACTADRLKGAKRKNNANVWHAVGCNERYCGGKRQWAETGWCRLSGHTVLVDTTGGLISMQNLTQCSTPFQRSAPGCTIVREGARFDRTKFTHQKQTSLLSPSQ